MVFSKKSKPSQSFIKSAQDDLDLMLKRVSKGKTPCLTFFLDDKGDIEQLVHNATLPEAIGFLELAKQKLLIKAQEWN